jgi:hypothetical protein
MPTFSVALHDMTAVELSPSKKGAAREGDAAKMHHVFAGMDLIVLLGVPAGVNAVARRRVCRPTSSSSGGLAIATELSDVVFCNADQVCRRAELLTIQAFAAEDVSVVRGWLGQCRSRRVLACVSEHAAVAVVAWQAEHADLPKCPGGHGALAATYTACLLQALSDLVHGAACRFAGDLALASMAEGAGAQRAAAEHNITLFNAGTAGSTWFPPLMVATAPHPDRPNLCFAAPCAAPDVAGALVLTTAPPTPWWPWRQTPVYLTLNRSAMQQVALWFMFLGAAIMVSALSIGIAQAIG